MNRKYVVVLTEAERERLRKLISASTAPARMLNRARILLRTDRGEHPGDGPTPAPRQADSRDVGDEHGYRGTRA